MKKIKLFPAPHVEVRLHVSDQMIADYKECLRQSMEEDTEESPCEECSWCDIVWLNTGMCELRELREILGGVTDG